MTNVKVNDDLGLDPDYVAYLKKKQQKEEDTQRTTNDEQRQSRSLA
jgi:hypothetical protein